MPLSPLDPLQWVIDTFAHAVASLPVKVVLTEDFRCDPPSDQLISILGRMEGLTELKVEKGVMSVHRLLDHLSKPDEYGEWPFPSLHTLEILATELVLDRNARAACRMVKKRYRGDGGGTPVAFKRLAFTDLPKRNFAEIQAVVGADHTENLADSSDDDDESDSSDKSDD